MKNASRIIGRFDNGRPGPLFICLGAIHGNEPAGVRAIEIVMTLLENEPQVNPDFTFHGRMIGVIGNQGALMANKRFLAEDMNRILTAERVKDVSFMNKLHPEEIEIKELVKLISLEIEEYEPDKVVLLDIHSTSASGGIFVITSEDAESVRIGKELHAPVVLDFVSEVKGTTLGFFTKKNFDTDMVTVVFECGQHSDPLSVNRAIAAIVNCMRTIGCIRADDVEHKHDQILQQYSAGLPKVARLIEHYLVDTNGQFRLTKEFENFEPVAAGEVIAFSGDRAIAAKHEGLILLPRLQDQGNDGFFIVQPEEDNS